MPGKPGRPPLDRAAYDAVKKRKSVTEESAIDTKQILGTNGVIEEDCDSKKAFKKKGFSWDHYLSEEFGISAPSKLFKNVRTYLF